jgi:CheY-like chemotaxis protein
VNKYAPDKQLPKILVIDDNCLFLETILDVLDVHGFQGIGTQRGRLGLQLAETQMPDVIICDIRMPELNGYQVLLKIRQNPATAKIPFIFITAEPIDHAQHIVKEMGANGYLTKPFVTSQLIQLIKAQLDGSTVLSL